MDNIRRPRPWQTMVAQSSTIDSWRNREQKETRSQQETQKSGRAHEGKTQGTAGCEEVGNRKGDHMITFLRFRVADACFIRYIGSVSHRERSGRTAVCIPVR
jgi:hypothetical protein